MPPIKVQHFCFHLSSGLYLFFIAGRLNEWINEWMNEWMNEQNVFIPFIISVIRICRFLCNDVINGKKPGHMAPSSGHLQNTKIYISDLLDTF